MAKTYAQLKAYARSRANMENSDFIGSTQEGFVINDAMRELYHLLVDGYEKYFVTTPIEFTLSGTYSVTVDTSLYKLLKVERKNGDIWSPVNPVNFASRADSTFFSYATPYSYSNTDKHGYCLVGRSLQITPEIDGTYRYWYVPDVTDLSLDTDVLSVELDRFWKYIALTAAIEYLEDEESDTGHLVKKIDSLKKEIQIYRQNRVQENYSIANVEPEINAGNTDLWAY